MAIATRKEYFFPEKKKEENKPKIREFNGRLYEITNTAFGGASAKDLGVGGLSAGEYQRQARDIAGAVSAEAEAKKKFAMPGAELAQRKGEIELGIVADLAAGKKETNKAGITAILNQLGLGETPGGGMDSVKGLPPPPYKAGQTPGVISKKELPSGSYADKLFPLLNMQGSDFPTIPGVPNTPEVPNTQSILSEDSNASIISELINAAKIKKVGTPKTKREQELYDKINKLGWF